MLATWKRVQKWHELSLGFRVPCLLSKVLPSAVVSAPCLQVPMLIDPNGTGKPIFESAEIMRYLIATYGVEEGKAA